jgi:hypothetical protein
MPAMSLDLPAANSTVTQPFVLGGWAIDLGSSSGPGVDVLHVYAYPNPGSGAPPVFVGAVSTGGGRDIAACSAASLPRLASECSFAGSMRARISSWPSRGH